MRLYTLPARRPRSVSPNAYLRILTAVAGTVVVTINFSTSRHLSALYPSDAPMFTNSSMGLPSTEKTHDNFTQVSAASPSPTGAVFFEATDRPPFNPYTKPPRPNTDKYTRLAKYKATYQYTPPATKQAEPAPECGNSPHFGPFFALSRKRRSRHDEDKIIYETFFRNKLQNGPAVGTYVELGAFNGLQESNSRFFDLCLGWKGLLIEGNPTTFRTMRRRRRSAHRMNFAPSCSEEYEMMNKTVEFAQYPMANAGLKGKAKTYDFKPMVSVPCGPLGPVLEDIFEGEIINFMSLDVEGAEAMVLRTIDFERVQIDVLMIEVENAFCTTEDCPVRSEVRAIMDQVGYVRYQTLVTASDIYVRPGSDFVLKDYPVST